MKSFLICLHIEKSFRIIGNFLICSSVFFIASYIRINRLDVEINLNTAKGELIEKHKLLSEKEFEQIVKNSQENTNKSHLHYFLGGLYDGKIVKKLEEKSPESVKNFYKTYKQDFDNNTNYLINLIKNKNI